MSIYDGLANCHPSISRGVVWCTTCGKSQKVLPSICLRDGWPKCCGYTMTIDSPEEREIFANQKINGTQEAGRSEST